MCKKKLTKLVDEYTSQIQTLKYWDLRNINWGGCGIFAERLYKLLVQLGYKPEIVVLTDELPKMQYQINNGDFYGNGTLDHVVVRVGKTYYDSEGAYTRKQLKGQWWKCQFATLELEHLAAMNKYPNLWSSVFNRSDTKKIERLLAAAYKKLEKDLVVSE